MVELKNVTIGLQRDGRPITDNFSFTLGPADKAVIIGEEGNGKSTLLKFIYDRGLVSGYCDFSGEIVTGDKLAYLPQTADERDCDKTLREYFADAGYYMQTAVLSKLGLGVDFITSEQKLGTLSGGEKVKVQLARLLMDQPDVLLLDEPTNDLDIEALEWLENYIRSTKLPVLFISHDETLIENAANVIIHMEQIVNKTQSRISVVRCSYREYLDFRRNSFEHRAQVAQKQRDDYERQMEKWRQIYSRVNSEQSSVSRQDPAGGRLLKKKMHTVLSMGKRFEREKENFLDFPEYEDAIIAKFGQTLALPAGKTVLDLTLPRLCIGERLLAENVRLFVAGNERVGITGSNGAGKSTLLELIWERLKDRRDIIAAFMPQDYAQVLDYEKSPVEYLAGGQTKDEITKARTYMGSMRFTRDEMTGKIGALSGGQRAKILYLDMVLKNANVLVLDEPTRNFSPLSCPVVRAALSDFKGAIISVSHDRKYLGEVCTKVYRLSESGLAEERRQG